MRSINLMRLAVLFFLSLSSGTITSILTILSKGNILTAESLHRAREVRKMEKVNFCSTDICVSV